MRHFVSSFLLLSLIFSSINAAAVELESLTIKSSISPVERLLEGSVEAISKATVSAETSGRVDSVLVDVGDRVIAGAVILKLVGSEQKESLNQANAALIEATTQSEVENEQYQRIKALYQKKLISKASYDQSNASYKTAKARVASAQAAVKRAQKQVSYTEIKAAYTGVVSARHVEVGEAVLPGMPLMTGFDADHLRVTVDLPQSIAKRIKNQPTIHIQLSEGELIQPAKIIFFPIADESTSTVRMRLVLPEKIGNLYPGELVKVKVQTGIKQKLLIPASSIVYRSEVVGIYVVDNKKGMVPKLRQIRIGSIDNQQVEVLAGLTAGESIALDPVAAGLYRAKEDSAEKNRNKE